MCIRDSAYILVNANGIVYFANPTERRVMDLKVEPFQTDFAHVHKDGLLILQGNSSSLIVRDLNDVHQKSISFVHDAEAEGNILSAKFASNGYWLVLSTSKVLKIFDLRKAPNTLAMEPIVLTQGSLKDWDIEPVSYTHLDVYKRQGFQYYRQVKCTKNCNVTVPSQLC